MATNYRGRYKMLACGGDRGCDMMPCYNKERVRDEDGDDLCWGTL